MGVIVYTKRRPKKGAVDPKEIIALLDRLELTVYNQSVAETPTSRRNRGGAARKLRKQLRALGLVNLPDRSAFGSPPKKSKLASQDDAR